MYYVHGLFPAEETTTYECTWGHIVAATSFHEVLKVACIPCTLQGGGKPGGYTKGRSTVEDEDIAPIWAQHCMIIVGCLLNVGTKMNMEIVQFFFNETS